MSGARGGHGAVSEPSGARRAVKRPHRGEWRQHPLVERLAHHLARARAWWRRATPAGLGLRAVVWLTGTAALVLALPPPIRSSLAVPVAVAALLPAARPGGSWVSVLELTGIGTVAAATTTGAYPTPLPVVVLVGALLYLHHCAAALAAQLRTDAVIPVAVFRHWAARTAAVVGGSAAVSLGVVALADAAPAGPAAGYLAVGVLAALGVTAVLALRAS